MHQMQNMDSVETTGNVDLHFKLNTRHLALLPIAPISRATYTAADPKAESR